MEYILRAKRTELTSKLMLSGSDGLSNDLRKMDPETQARLETLLEAAGTLMFFWASFYMYLDTVIVNSIFFCYTFSKLYVK